MKQLLEFFGKFTDPVVGVDISASSVKVMQIEKDGDGYLLSDYAVAQIYDEMEEAQWISHHAEALTQALEKTNIKTNRAAISIPSSQSFTKIIQMDVELTDREIAEELQLEAERYIPYALSEVMLDHQILGVSSKNKGLNDVLLAASKTEQVQDRIAVVESAGLKASVVDIDVFAKQRAFSLVSDQLPNSGEGMIVGLVDIGGNSTSMDVFDSFKPIYSRDQNFGGKQLLDEIINRYGLTMDEAVLAIDYGGLPIEYPHDVLEPFKQTIAQQISRACQFFFSAGDYTKIDYLFLTGGVSSIPGLDKVIEGMVNIKTTVANPFTKMKLSPEVDEESLMKDSSSLLNGCGLALRNIIND